MGKIFFVSFAQLNDYQNMTEAAVFKVSMRFNQKIKKVAVSPKKVKFFCVAYLCSGKTKPNILDLWTV